MAVLVPIMFAYSKMDCGEGPPLSAGSVGVASVGSPRIAFHMSDATTSSAPILAANPAGSRWRKYAQRTVEMGRARALGTATKIHPASRQVESSENSESAI